MYLVLSYASTTRTCQWMTMKTRFHQFSSGKLLWRHCETHCSWWLENAAEPQFRLVLAALAYSSWKQVFVCDDWANSMLLMLGVFIIPTNTSSTIIQHVKISWTTSCCRMRTLDTVSSMTRMTSLEVVMSVVKRSMARYIRVIGGPNFISGWELCAYVWNV